VYGMNRNTAVQRSPCAHIASRSSLSSRGMLSAVPATETPHCLLNTSSRKVWGAAAQPECVRVRADLHAAILPRRRSEGRQAFTNGPPTR